MAEQQTLGPVLITGGNGFIAYHIIAKILEEEPDCSIHALDINTSRNRHPQTNVQYHQVDLGSAADIAHVVEIVRPVTIFHTASPEYYNVPASAYRSVIVNCALHLLSAAAQVGTVRAFINHSSSSVIHDNHSDMVEATEKWPVLRPPQQPRSYSLAKADAEAAIIAANRGDHGLLTCSLRPSTPFGERDTEALGKMVAVAQQGRTRFQMGNGRNLYDFVYIGNLADAHILAAKALLTAWGRPPADPSVRVDGECFNITNGDHWYFWDFQRAVSAQTGHPVRQEDIVVIPKWVGMLLGFMSEWFVWLISGGKRSANMTVDGIRFSTMTRTLNIDKAKRRLRYQPKVSMQEGIERGVRWFMEEQEKKHEEAGK